MAEKKKKRKYHKPPGPKIQDGPWQDARHRALWAVLVPLGFEKLVRVKTGQRDEGGGARWFLIDAYHRPSAIAVEIVKHGGVNHKKLAFLAEVCRELWLVTDDEHFESQLAGLVKRFEER